MCVLMCNFVSYFVCVILCIFVFLCDILLPSGVINDDDDYYLFVFICCKYCCLIKYYKTKLDILVSSTTTVRDIFGEPARSLINYRLWRAFWLSTLPEV